MLVIRVPWQAMGAQVSVLPEHGRSILARRVIRRPPFCVICLEPLRRRAHDLQDGVAVDRRGDLNSSERQRPALPGVRAQPESPCHTDASRRRHGGNPYRPPDADAVSTRSRRPHRASRFWAEGIVTRRPHPCRPRRRRHRRAFPRRAPAGSLLQLTSRPGSVLSGRLGAGRSQVQILSPRLGKRPVIARLSRQASRWVTARRGTIDATLVAGRPARGAGRPWARRATGQRCA
jgi:hypothetical protein